jgi:CHAD domain-containing protein
MARYRVCFIKDIIVNYTSKDIQKLPTIKEITLRELKEIKGIRIYDKRTHQSLKCFIDKQSLTDYRDEIICLEKEIHKLKTEIKEVREQLEYSEQQLKYSEQLLEYYKSINEL